MNDTKIRKWKASSYMDWQKFNEEFCFSCKYDTEDYCLFMNMAWSYRVDDPRYPEEIQVDQNGRPMCTVFEEGDYESR